MNDSSHLRVLIKPRSCCGSALSHRNRYSYAFNAAFAPSPIGDHNLLARFIGHVTCGKKAGDTGLAGGINDNPALCVQRNPTPHQVGVRPQPEFHIHPIHVERALGAIRPFDQQSAGMAVAFDGDRFPVLQQVTWSAAMSFRPR